uniref:Uncharacterized protein n=1 Tax=Physcomitrium patens TaxID=3218 RepID=A0A2K1KC06_PHYPA|nr:hypothetical protein PHYPA_010493 [Physcomitrium patens]
MFDRATRFVSGCTEAHFLRCIALLQGFKVISSLWCEVEVQELDFYESGRAYVRIRGCTVHCTDNLASETNMRFVQADI